MRRLRTLEVSTIEIDTNYKVMPWPFMNLFEQSSVPTCLSDFRKFSQHPKPLLFCGTTEYSTLQKGCRVGNHKRRHIPPKNQNLYDTPCNAFIIPKLTN